ncbi:TetR/AcrR family transcriptional regulator [Paraburkholderia sp. BL23I1N1]|uniref:TetR/AcrR family transcriptional regulator n=1 Tax=Paraburkholderia sp. BL23I1N1 TaxID=1938802 RepID=UPI0016025710|nr:TetR/AcrR family transcriptional regulator [Paraburkholderia sp. BL23I1N1]
MRQALIEAGRRVFATRDYAKVSLRGIAADAGYAPTIVYHYFADRQALFVASRETDLADAIAEIAAVAQRGTDPAARLRKLLVTMLRHWRAHFEQYEILLSGSPRTGEMSKSGDGAPFGQSEVAIRAYEQYRAAVRDFFDTLPCYPMPLKLATDSFVVAIHGAVAVPMHLETRKWSSGEKLAITIADTFIAAWTAAANQPSE